MDPLDLRVCERARLARDPRFDGRFFIGVTTTGIYCRPICPARTARAANVRYFESAAAAAAAGFRPCLRCRPEAAPGSPAWHGTSAVVGRALRLIGEGVWADGGVDGLAARLGIGPRHLHRLFVQHVGAPPVAVAQTWRLGFAKRLLDETSLPIAQVALVSGFGSIRRFNDAFRQAYERPPSVVRKGRASNRAGSRAGRPYRLTLAYRPPYDWSALVGFLAARATPGVEVVEPDRYRRTITHRGAAGVIEVRPLALRHALEVTIAFPEPASLPHIVARIRMMFDLAADPDVIRRAFGRDPVLGRLVREHPGLRVPAGWDSFELAVRAIVGQQVSVRGATTLMGRLVSRLGLQTADGAHTFPSAEAVACASVEELGVTAMRAHAIRAVAREVAGGRLRLAADVDVPETVRLLTTLPGIGDWTAQYIAMRGLGDPDAFPSGDLGLRIAAGDGRRLHPHELARRAARWRPWRAYAAMHLWQSLGDRAPAQDKASSKSRHDPDRGLAARSPSAPYRERRAGSALA